MPFLSKWSGEILSLLRIVASFMFIQHGTQKMFGFPVEAVAPYELMTLSPGLAGLLEVILGPLLLVGIFTRHIAFVLSGFMAFAYFMVHAPRGFWTLANGGDAAVLYCFVFLYIAAAGGGRWSIDALRSRST
ncbi:MAG TPA: DoxX family protein [Gammaproteobacteria bacterium]|nr:DoxX family protein [Gammaproteobacteria bacterium]